jgi:hypothetical protein
MRNRTLIGLSAAVALLGAAEPAAAQFQPAPQQPYPPGQYGGQVGGQVGGGQYGGQYGGYGQPPGFGYPQPQTGRKKSTALEVGYLYVTAGAYGVGTGIWIDAMAGIDDPGLRLIMPGVLGVAAPVGVFVLDQYVYRPAMPEGLPSAIATGFVVGAGEGLGVASTQWVRADEANEWTFKGLASSEVIGSTLGGAGGYALYYFLRPHPKSNIFIASSVFWGSAIGSFFGGGVSSSVPDNPAPGDGTGTWGKTNDTVALGGLIGFNVALGGAVLLSAAGWRPSWDQIGWMWGGLALGTVVSLPVYLFYAGSDHDPRRGLVFQGVAGTLGLVAGALIGRPDKPGAIAEAPSTTRPAFAKIRGGGLMPIDHGIGAQVSGELW